MTPKAGLLLLVLTAICQGVTTGETLDIWTKSLDAGKGHVDVNMDLFFKYKTREEFPILRVPSMEDGPDVFIKVNTFTVDPDGTHFVGGLSPEGSRRHGHFWLYYSATIGMEGALELHRERTGYAIESGLTGVVVKRVPLHSIVGDPFPTCDHDDVDDSLIKDHPMKDRLHDAELSTRNLADLPILNSNPSAEAVILMDFDGHTVSSGPWLSSNGGNPIVATPYVRSGHDPNTFSSQEVAEMIKIWKRVAEDFAPFQVTVTTDEAVYDAAPVDRRMRNIVTHHDSWYPNAGGVAYLRSFRSSFANVCWTFCGRLSGGGAKSVAEASSHEVGHTLGLSHDGLTGANAVGYYRGHGSGATGWGPIMGVGYYEALSQWSKGEYAEPSETEDDLLIITSDNNFGYRPDDHGDTHLTATPLTLGTSINDLAAEGIISEQTDVDFFRIDVATIGSLQINALPFEEGPNLDIELTLFDATGVSVLASDNPLSGISASITYNSPGAGTYYLRVDGVGMGDVPYNSYSDPQPSNIGYSDYGSLGTYYIYAYYGAACGDGTVDPAEGEECDPGAPVAGDCCRDDCTFEAAGFECRAAGGLCGIAETCSGASATCPTDNHLSSGTVCRAATGECDVPETCSGSSPTCPTDAVATPSVECRAAAGPCDVADMCDGSSKTCGADNVQGTSFVCRPAADDCDVEETCDGATTDCPADGYQPDTHVCRPAAGLCDEEETCTGAGVTCPADAYHPVGTVCRPSTGFCDLEEACSGSSVSCPADAFQTNGLACNDTFACTLNDVCTDGVCLGTGTCVCGNGIVEALEECDDGNTADGDCCSSTCTFEAAGAPCPADALVCTTDACDGAGVCVHDPHPDNSTCDDGVVCNGIDYCFNSTCSRHELPDCVDAAVGEEGAVVEADGDTEAAGGDLGVILIIVGASLCCCILLAVLVFLVVRSRRRRDPYGFKAKPAATPMQAKAGSGTAPPAGAVRHRAKFDFVGNADELPFRTGEFVYIVEEFDDGWGQAWKGGKTGAVPLTYLEKAPAPAPAAARPPPPPMAANKPLPPPPMAANKALPTPPPQQQPPPPPPPAAKPSPPAAKKPGPPPAPAKKPGPPPVAAKPPPVAAKPPPVKRKPAGDWVVTKFDYVSENDDELQFYPNERIRVLERFDDGWANGVLRGVTGVFPLSYTKPAPAPPVKPKPPLPQK